MIPIEEFKDDGRSIANYGLDSVVSVELRGWLAKQFGLDYPLQKILSPKLTLKTLAEDAAEAMESNQLLQ